MIGYRQQNQSTKIKKTIIGNENQNYLYTIIYLTENQYLHLKSIPYLQLTFFTKINNYYMYR